MHCYIDVRIVRILLKVCVLKYSIWHDFPTKELNYVDHKPNHTAFKRENVTKLISKT